MSRQETFNKFILLLNAICVGSIVGFVIVALLSGCTTPEPRGALMIKRACPEPTIEIVTPEKWSSRDQHAYDTASKRCRDLYLNSPCLKRFIRMEQGRYRAVCGGLNENYEFEVFE